MIISFIDSYIIGTVKKMILVVTLFLVASTARAQPNLTVDRVEVSGVTVLSIEEVQSAMEIVSGDKLDRGAIIKSAENLSGLYYAKGYEQIKVETRLNSKRTAKGKIENILDFSIAEGLPTRISEVEFSLIDVTLQKNDSFEEKLGSRITLKEGDLFSENEISAARRTIEDYLASQEYIGAKVKSFIPIETAEPKELKAIKAAKWVKVRFEIELGGRITFGFRGNTFFSRGELSDSIEEQRLIGFSENFIRDIRNKLIEVYKDSGFSDIKIHVQTQEKPEYSERHVSFIIDEGVQFLIKEIQFDGNSVFSNDALTSRLYESDIPLLKQGIYSEKYVNKGAELLIEWIKSQGYLQAKLVTINTIVMPKRRAAQKSKEVKLIIYLYEGTQTLVHSVQMSGITAFSEQEVKNILDLEIDKPLNLFTFTEGLELLKSKLRNFGYLDVEMLNEGTDKVVLYSQENRYADIHLVISQGTQYRVGKVLVDGIQQTQEMVVLRELRLGPGDIVDESRIIESEALLRKLGIFSSVSIRPVDSAVRPDLKDLRVIVQEASPGIIAGGVGFRNDLGPRVFSQVGYSNLFGKNHSILLTTTTNRRLQNYRFIEYQAQISYIWPWFILDRTTFRPSLTLSGLQYINFDAISIVGAATWERQFFNVPHLTAVFTYSIERVNQFNARDAVDNQGIRIGSISPTLRYDLRDNPLAPTSGLFLTSTFDYASTWLGSQTEPFPIGYTRLQFRGDHYLRLYKRVTWYLSARAGFERSLVTPVLDENQAEIRPSGAIPLVKQFALGGVGTIRGFNEQEINLYQSLIRGTAFYSNYRTQVDLPLLGSLRFGPFFDMGNLIQDPLSVSELFGGFRIGAGVGLRYITPFGPVNLDWGFKIKPAPGEDPSRIHFSIGTF